MLKNRRFGVILRLCNWRMGVAMKSRVVKRSLVVGGHKTSVSLEDDFWIGLKEVAGTRQTTVSNLVSAIDQGRGKTANLSSAIRLYVLQYYRERADKSIAA